MADTKHDRAVEEKAWTRSVYKDQPNAALKQRGSTPSVVVPNEGLRARGTTLQYEGPPSDDGPPTPLGQGGIGSDSVADQIAPDDASVAHAKGGRVGYAKGGSVKGGWRKYGW